MDSLIGLLKVHVVKGQNLANRDINASDPYVIATLGHQTVKTKVVKNNLNPHWNDQLTLGVHKECPHLKLVSKMASLIGLLKVHVVKGQNLAKRDIDASDPYVIVTLGHQTVNTKVVKNNLNPYWNEELTLGVHKECPHLKLQVMDKDKLTQNDPIGHVEVDLGCLAAAAKVYEGTKPQNTDREVGRIHASNGNRLVNGSILWLTNKGVKQDIHLKLKDVESGELFLELYWAHAV